jgi:hypothetical protein
VQVPPVHERSLVAPSLQVNTVPAPAEALQRTPLSQVMVLPLPFEKLHVESALHVLEHPVHDSPHVFATDVQPSPPPSASHRARSQMHVPELQS